MGSFWVLIWSYPGNVVAQTLIFFLSSMTWVALREKILIWEEIVGVINAFTHNCSLISWHFENLADTLKLNASGCLLVCARVCACVLLRLRGYTDSDITVWHSLLAVSCWSISCGQPCISYTSSAFVMVQRWFLLSRMLPHLHTHTGVDCSCFFRLGFSIYHIVWAATGIQVMVFNFSINSGQLRERCLNSFFVHFFAFFLLSCISKQERAW